MPEQAPSFKKPPFYNDLLLCAGLYTEAQTPDLWGTPELRESIIELEQPLPPNQDITKRLRVFRRAQWLHPTPLTDERGKLYYRYRFTGEGIAEALGALNREQQREKEYASLVLAVYQHHLEA